MQIILGFILIAISAIGGFWGTQLVREGFAAKKNESKAVDQFQKVSGEVSAQAASYFRVAENDYAQKNYKDAIFSYKKSIRLLPTTDAYMKLGFSCVSDSNFEGAIEAFLAGSELAGRQRNDKLYRNFIENLGAAYLTNRDWDNAISNLKHALTIAQKIDGPEIKISIINKLIVAYAKKNDSENLQKTLDQLVALSGGKAYLQDIATAHNSLGNVWDETGFSDKALTEYESALDLFEKAGDSVGQQSALHNMGNHFFYQKNFSKSKYYWDRALDKARQTKLRGREADALHELSRIGLIFSANDADELEKTFSLASQAYEIYSEVNSVQGKANSLFQLGLISAELKKNEAANGFLGRAADYYKALNDKRTFDTVENIRKSLSSK